MEFKEIKGFNGKYKVSKEGLVYSCHKKGLLRVSPSKTSPYFYVDLWKNNKGYHKSIHRLVAEAYIPNPENLPEVDHIDREIWNNNVSNLRWVSRAQNLENTEEGFVRNFRECSLYYNGKFIGNFHSKMDACRKASSMGASCSGLNRNSKSKGFEIKSGTTSSMERRVEN